MKLPHRRQFLHLATGAAALPTLSRVARAQAYPTRPVRIVVGFAPGGASDILARLMGQWLTERLSQPFIIDNRPGASSNIGTEAVVKASPDGHTLLMVSTTNAINATLYDKLSFDILRDIAPVVALTREPHVIVLNPSVPAKTLPEFIAYAKVNPGEIKHGIPGQGNWTSHSRRVVQNHDRRGHGPHPLSWYDTRICRSAWWTGAGHVPRAGFVDRVHQRRPAARAGGDHRYTL